MDERARRVGLNEAMFRTVNDEVRGLNDRFSVVVDPMRVVWRVRQRGLHRAPRAAGDGLRAPAA